MVTCVSACQIMLAPVQCSYNHGKCKCASLSRAARYDSFSKSYKLAKIKTMWLQEAHNAMRHDFNYLGFTGLRARDNNSSFNVLHDYTSLLPRPRGSSFEENDNRRKSKNWLSIINRNAFEIGSNPHLNIRLGCFFVLCLWSWKVLILRSSKDWNCRRAFPLF